VSVPSGGVWMVEDADVSLEFPSEMGIAELAQRAGVTPRTIRYYVAEGLLPPAGGRGQRRAYTEEHLRRLEVIGQLKAAYLPLREIRRRFTSLGPGESGQFVHAVARPAFEPGLTPPAPVVSTGPTAGLDQGTHSGAVPSGRFPLGFDPSPGMGKIEIYEPIETVWHRHVLAPGVELHVRETDDPKLVAAVERLLREAGEILDGDAPTS
jgi:DNA-binding transcriptional MerR regulator